MEKLSFILMAIVIAVAAITSFDWVAYIVKKAPTKSAQFTKFTWRLGFFCVIVIIYWILNDYSLF